MRCIEIRYKLSDGNGLYLEVLTSGKKVWRFRYRVSGRDNTKTIGEYPFVSLKEARVAALDYKEKLEKNEPLTLDKNEKTFEEVVEKFLAFKEKSLSKKYFREQRGKIQNYLYPTLKNKKISKIKKADILSLLEKIPNIRLKNDTKSTQNKSETIRKVLILTREIFRFALHNDYISINPADAIDSKQIVPKREVQHFKAELDIDELRKIYCLIDEYPSELTKNALKFLMLTALRAGNIRNLVWKWVDLKKGVIVFPAEIMKNRDEFRLPLTNTLKNVLNTQKELTESEFVFPSPIAPSKRMSENTLRFALKRMDLDIVPHGFRSSFSTICYEKQKEHGFSMEVIENQLSHKVGNAVTRAYLRSDFLEERRELLIWWEEFLRL